MFATELFAILERYQTTSSPIAGWELASDRGNLSSSEEAELVEMKRASSEALAEANERWARATPHEIATYDALVDALLERQGGVALAESARPRALPTRSPTRAFDAWAIWAVLKLGAS